ncbi:pentapeptide repeat-containing protein [Helicobacter pullorum]|uniref:pentapeptide repeat-containing protein n=1 Tax=Helicobacter pullorum TaxID=35818 RepID=UPI000A64C69A|nr:pentapeptide repeat-containing protein [Helicobacter pullorum]
MKHLTKEQEQEIWDKVSKEVENFDTFLDKSQCIDEISNKVKSISEGMVQLSWTTLDETLKRTKEITYELIGIKEIRATLGEYVSIQYNSNTFCIMPKPKIQPYDENQQDSKDLQKQDMCPISCCDLSILFRKYPLLFMNCVFQCENLNTHFIENLNKLCFIQCEFKGKITLTFKECLDVFLMSHCTFEKPLTIHGKFKENADFNNSIFQDSVDFSQCEFEKTANFYGVEFKKVPNFSQTQFKGSLNVVNTNLDFDFESLKEKIKQEHRQQNTNSKKSLVHFVNDFRDSFRIFKSTLIKDNNLLDASNFHKYELYSKEIELDSKETKTIKDKVEKWQLWFYRNLCDHHTDLVLNLKWLVYTIALYVLLLGKIPFVYPVAIFVFCVYVYMRGFKNVWLIVSSAIVFITILDTPKIILGISNLFGENLNLWQNFITTLYVIAIGLVLFSLQKTARKNSIVPN